MKTILTLLILLLPLRASAASDRFIAASGNALKNNHGHGDVVTLRGVNLGGWLVFEPWMTPMDSAKLPDEHSARVVLTKRFGAAKSDELIDDYEDHWITDDDLERIAATGLNTVRVPFWYRTVETEDGVWRADAFKHLDWIVQHAATHGLYVILDLHGVPGGQSDSDSTGRSRKEKGSPPPDFFTKKANITRAVEIWKRVANHFKGNPTVAAYDLLNEPIAAPTRDALWAVYDQLFKAVRSSDPDHVITVEGCWGGQVNGKYMGWGLDVLPRPEKFGWTNVLYQVHSYEWAWNDLNKQLASTRNLIASVEGHREWNVPVYLGEFSCFAPEDAWKDAIPKFDAAGISWTMWSYKSTHGTGSDSWGLYNAKKKAPAKPDLENDTPEEIAADWEQWTTEAAFEANPMLQPILAAPRPAPIIGGDVSALPDLEKAGAIYRDDSGIPGDGLAILHAHGMTAFRLRLFVDPDTNFDRTAGANQNLPAVLAMAKRVKATGAKLIVDLHYSDTWADPAHQQKPKAWAGLHGEDLERKVESYTADVMQKLKANGTPPDFVQIGNETTDGLLFPDGNLSGDDKADDAKRWTAAGRLFSAGSRGVRSVFPKDQTRVIIHISSGGKAGVPTWFFDHIAEQKVDFDVIGLSFYPMWGDSMDDLKKNLAGLVKHGRQIMIMETAEPYRDHKVKADAKISWPLTPQGQKKFLAELMNVVGQTPGGIGVVWWYPEIEDRPKMRIWEGAATSWFDQEGRVLPIGR
jgi:endoglucanase